MEVKEPVKCTLTQRFGCFEFQHSDNAHETSFLHAFPAAIGSGYFKLLGSNKDNLRAACFVTTNC